MSSFAWELTALGILLAVLIVAGGVAVVRVRRWRNEDVAPLTLEEQLESYQALVDRGELDPREFERIKAYLKQRQEEPAPPSEPETGIQAERPARVNLPPDTRIQ